ncbi:MAG: ArnT family glycosyltransferase [Armatimonadota bacterium]
MRKSVTPYVALTLVCLALFAWRLGATPLVGLDEGLYSECAREMAAGGSWVVPAVNGLPFFEKPPLAYWLMAASIRLLGANSFAARLPSCLAGFVLVALSVWLGTKLFGRRAGLMSGFALGTCIMTIGLARMALLDMLFALAIAASLGTFLLARLGLLSRRGYLVFWAAAGLSALVKGPAGPVLIAGTVLAFAAVRRQPRVLLAATPLAGFAVFVLVALPWYTAVQVQTRGEFLREFILHQNVQRALGQDFQHNMPFYFYVPTYLVGFFPWSVFIPLAWIRFVRINSTDSAEEASLFAGVWIVAMVLIFSISRSKLPAYVYPVYPASALLIGRLWSEAVDGQATDSLRRYAMVATALAAVVAGAFLLGPRFIPHPVPGAGTALGAMGLSLVAGVFLCLVALLKRRVTLAFAALCVGAGVMALCAIGLALPIASRALAEPAVAVAKEVRRIARPELPVFAYQLSPPQSALPFYAGRPVLPQKTPEAMANAVRGLRSFLVIGQEDRLDGLPAGGKLVSRRGRYLIYRFDR